MKNLDSNGSRLSGPCVDILLRRYWPSKSCWGIHQLQSRPRGPSSIEKVSRKTWLSFSKHWVKKGKMASQWIPTKMCNRQLRKQPNLGGSSLRPIKRIKAMRLSRIKIFSAIRSPLQQTNNISKEEPNNLRDFLALEREEAMGHYLQIAKKNDP